MCFSPYFVTCCNKNLFSSAICHSDVGASSLKLCLVVFSGGGPKKRNNESAQGRATSGKDTNQL